MVFDPKISRLCTSLLAMLVFFSCKQSANEQNQSASELALVDSTSFSLDTFKEFPEAVMGCSCTFSLDSSEYAAGEYVFVNDLGNIAVIRVNGEMTELKQTSYADLDSTTTVTTYENLDFWLKIEIMDGPALDYEVSRKTAKLTIGNASGKEVSVDLFGICGC